MAEQEGQHSPPGRVGETADTPWTADGSIEPEAVIAVEQVTVQTSAFVDDFATMYYEVNGEGISFYFGAPDDKMHVAFTDRSLINLARLANQAVCATLRVRGIPVPEWVGQVDQGHVDK